MSSVPVRRQFAAGAQVAVLPRILPGDDCRFASQNGVPAEVPFVAENQASAAQRRHGSRTISGLSSAAFHLTLLVLLGACLLPAGRGGDREILLSFSGRQAPELLENFSFSPAINVVDTSDTRQDELVPEEDSVALPVVEPTLFSIEDANATVGDLLAVGSRASRGGRSASPDGPEGEGSASPGKPSASGTSGQSEFFGISAYGNEFVYVLDMSTSMLEKSRYGRTRVQVAAEELIRSVDNLAEDQKFFVILFCYQTRLLFDRNSAVPKMVTATPSNKRLLRAWLRQIQMAPGTDPRLGVLTALRMKPSAIFLLSDGEFNGREKKNGNLIPGNPKVEQIVAAQNRHSTPIHTIAFEDKSNRKRLRRLAEATGGTHRFVSSNDQHDELLDELKSEDSDDAVQAMQSIAKSGDMIGAARRRRAAPILIGMLAADDAESRDWAHRALLAISNGRDLGPEGEPPTEQEIKESQKRWARFWRKLANSS